MQNKWCDSVIDFVHIFSPFNQLYISSGKVIISKWSEASPGSNYSRGCSGSVTRDLILTIHFKRQPWCVRVVSQITFPFFHFWIRWKLLLLVAILFSLGPKPLKGLCLIETCQQYGKINKKCRIVAPKESLMLRIAINYSLYAHEFF